jgi:hypothetical protein
MRTATAKLGSPPGPSYLLNRGRRRLRGMRELGIGVGTGLCPGDGQGLRRVADFDQFFEEVAPFRLLPVFPELVGRPGSSEVFE